MDNELTIITTIDGEEFQIDRSDPNHDKLVEFANDADTRKNMKKIGITDTDKQLAYYLKYKRSIPQASPTSLTERERLELEKKPSYAGLGIGKRGEALAEAVKKFHRTTEE